MCVGLAAWAEKPFIFLGPLPSSQPSASTHGLHGLQLAGVNRLWCCCRGSGCFLRTKATSLITVFALNLFLHQIMTLFLAHMSLALAVTISIATVFFGACTASKSYGAVRVRADGDIEVEPTNANGHVRLPRLVVGDSLVLQVHNNVTYINTSESSGAMFVDGVDVKALSTKVDNLEHANDNKCPKKNQNFFRGDAGAFTASLIPDNAGQLVWIPVPKTEIQVKAECDGFALLSMTAHAHTTSDATNNNQILGTLFVNGTRAPNDEEFLIVSYAGQPTYVPVSARAHVPVAKGETYVFDVRITNLPGSDPSKHHYVNSARVNVFMLFDP